LGPGPDADRGAAVLATGQGKPTGLAVSSGRLFWANEDDGTIVACDAASCVATLTTIASGLTVPRGVTVEGAHVLFVSEAGVGQCPTTGCPGAPTSLIAAVDFGVAADADRVVATRFPDLLAECPRDGCPPDTEPVQLAFGQGMMGVWLTSDTIYFTRFGTQNLDQCPIDTDCLTTGTTFQTSVASAVSVIADDQYVYWARTDYLNFPTPSFTGEIVRCPLAGCDGDPEILVSDAEPFGIALDGSTLYYTDHAAGTIHRQPL